MEIVGLVQQEAERRGDGGSWGMAGEGMNEL